MFSVIDAIEYSINQFPPNYLCQSDQRQRKLFDAFSEHVKHEKVRKYLDQYNSDVQEFEDIYNEIEFKIDKVQISTTENLPDEVKPSDWTNDLCKAFKMGSSPDDLSAQEYEPIRCPDSLFEIYWRKAIRLTRISVEEKHVQQIINTHGEFIQQAVELLLVVKNFSERFTLLGEKIKDELESLKIKRLIPGHCEYCPF